MLSLRRIHNTPKIIGLRTCLYDPWATSVVMGSQGASVPRPWREKSEIVRKRRVNPRKMRKLPAAARGIAKGDGRCQIGENCRVMTERTMGTITVTMHGIAITALVTLHGLVQLSRLLLSDRLGQDYDLKNHQGAPAWIRAPNAAFFYLVFQGDHASVSSY